MAAAARLFGGLFGGVLGIGVAWARGAELVRWPSWWTDLHPAVQAAGGTALLIDESYNANPASMRAAIAVLAASQPTGEGRRIAVLGDMLEMGEFAPSVHADLAGPLLAAGIEHVWLAGPEMVALRDALPETVHVVYLETTEELANFVTAEVRPGDVVMVKSSLGIGFGKIVSALLDKHPAFPDTERHF